MGKNSKHPHEGQEKDTLEIAVQCIGVLNQPIEKKINGVQTGKEKTKVSLFAYDMILWIRNPYTPPENS